MSQLWNPDGSKSLHPHILAYTVGDDPVLDQHLIPYDVLASRVHAQMLGRIGILTANEVSQLEEGFDAIIESYDADGFDIQLEDEDGHTAIEKALIGHCGDLGKKIHAGRSRNDQVLVALKLYILDQLTQVDRLLAVMTRRLLRMVRENESMPMPGYSHTQQAMLTSVGHWLAAHLESLTDDRETLRFITRSLSRSPLGSAAGFGSTLPLDRQFTASELGFDAVQLNSLYCQNSRGKMESLYLEGLNQVMASLGRLASDLILFTSREFAYFKVDPGLTTGSSIMPQKRNLDGLEILRANVSEVTSLQSLVRDLSLSRISGYHRDNQLMKRAVMEASAITQHSIMTAFLYLGGLQANEDNLRNAVRKDIFAADIATEMVSRDGLPFRDAYAKALEQLADQEIDLNKALDSRQSPGSAGNLQFEVYENRLKAMETLPRKDGRDDIQASCPECEQDIESQGFLAWSSMLSVICPSCAAVTCWSHDGYTFVEKDSG